MAQSRRLFYRQRMYALGKSARESNRLTIEDRTCEETEEFDEQVLLLCGDFVPSIALAAGLNLMRRDPLPDVSLEQLFRDEAGVCSGGMLRVVRTPEGVPRLALANIRGVGLSGLVVVSLGIFVGRNVLL
jgi:hypothetical protein